MAAFVGGPFFDVFFNELMGISIWRMSAFFDHSTRKSWFCIVFYSTFALWAIFENVFFWLFLAVFVSPLSWLARGAWVTFLVMFWSCKRKILISYCFLQHFGAAGTSWNGFFLRLFLFFMWFFCLGEHVACIWCVNAFFNHSRRKSWFRIVFYSILEPSAPLEKVFF